MFICWGTIPASSALVFSTTVSNHYSVPRPLVLIGGDALLGNHGVSLVAVWYPVAEKDNAQLTG
jgi:hypothetical protein